MREIAQHILDICENSIAAGAALIKVKLAADDKEGQLVIEITDDGCGMDEQMLKKAVSPFVTTRTTRRVGLGLPLFKAGCEATGGSFKVESQQGAGTRVTARYILNHIDRPPLGELAEALHALVIANPGLDFAFKLVYNHTIFEMDTRQVKKTLGGVPVNNAEVSGWLLEYIQDGVKEIFGGKHI